MNKSLLWAIGGLALLGIGYGIYRSRKYNPPSEKCGIGSHWDEDSQSCVPDYVDPPNDVEMTPEAIWERAHDLCIEYRDVPLTPVCTVGNLYSAPLKICYITPPIPTPNIRVTGFKFTNIYRNPVLKYGDVKTCWDVANGNTYYDPENEDYMGPNFTMVAEDQGWAASNPVPKPLNSDYLIYESRNLHCRLWRWKGTPEGTAPSGQPYTDIYVHNEVQPSTGKAMEVFNTCCNVGAGQKYPGAVQDCFVGPWQNTGVILPPFMLGGGQPGYGAPSYYECWSGEAELTIVSPVDWIVPPGFLTIQVSFTDSGGDLRYGTFTTPAPSESIDKSSWIHLTANTPYKLSGKISGRVKNKSLTAVPLGVYNLKCDITYGGCVMSYNNSWYDGTHDKDETPLTFAQQGFVMSSTTDPQAVWVSDNLDIRQTILSYSIAQSELYADVLKVQQNVMTCGCGPYGTYGTPGGNAFIDNIPGGTQNISISVSGQYGQALETSWDVHEAKADVPSQAENYPYVYYWALND